MSWASTRFRGELCGNYLEYHLNPEYVSEFVHTPIARALHANRRLRDLYCFFFESFMHSGGLTHIGSRPHEVVAIAIIARANSIGNFKLMMLVRLLNTAHLHECHCYYSLTYREGRWSCQANDQLGYLYDLFRYRDWLLRQQ